MWIGKYQAYSFWKSNAGIIERRVYKTQTKTAAQKWCDIFSANEGSHDITQAIVLTELF